MTLYETIWNFIMTYILGVGFFDNSIDFDIFQGLFFYLLGTDGRWVWAPFAGEFMGGTYNFIELFGHFLTIFIIFSFVFGLFRLLASIFRIGRR